MSTQLNGLSDAIVFASPVSITSTTDATPIVVTAAAHGMTTGDVCSVYDHTVNTNANGEWVVTVLTANTFSLDSSVGTGAGDGGATGTVQPLSCGATFQIPADGDPDAAATFNPAYEALADRTALLSAVTGRLKLARTAGAHLDPALAALPTSWATASGISGTPSAWASLATILTVTEIQATDYIDFWLATTAQVSSGVGTGGSVRFSLGYSLDAPGVSPTPAELPGSGQAFVYGSGSTIWSPIHLHGVITNAARAGTLTLYVGQVVYTGGPAVGMGLYDSYSTEAKVYRTTGFPQ